MHREEYLFTQTQQSLVPLLRTPLIVMDHKLKTSVGWGESSTSRILTPVLVDVCFYIPNFHTSKLLPACRDVLFLRETFFSYSANFFPPIRTLMAVYAGYSLFISRILLELTQRSLFCLLLSLLRTVSFRKYRLVGLVIGLLPSVKLKDFNIFIVYAD